MAEFEEPEIKLVRKLFLDAKFAIFLTTRTGIMSDILKNVKFCSSLGSPLDVFRSHSSLCWAPENIFVFDALNLAENNFSFWGPILLISSTDLSYFDFVTFSSGLVGSVILRNSN